MAGGINMQMAGIRTVAGYVLMANGIALTNRAIYVMDGFGTTRIGIIVVRMALCWPIPGHRTDIMSVRAGSGFPDKRTGI